LAEVQEAAPIQCPLGGSQGGALTFTGLPSAPALRYAQLIIPGETMRRLWLAALLLNLLAGAAAYACDSPQQMDGFKTCADVAKAEQEGALVVYATDP